LLETPPFPSCTSGHSTFSGAAAQILALFFARDEVRFTDTSETSRATRTFASFSEAAEEAGRSRVYGGIHFEFDNSAGLQSGRAVARYIFDRYFKPLGASSDNKVAARETFRRAADEIGMERGPATSTSYYRTNGDFWHANSNPISYSGGGGSSPIACYCLPATSYIAPTAEYVLSPIVVPNDPMPVLYFQPTTTLPQITEFQYLNSGW
jgi:hypothetical protein